MRPCCTPARGWRTPLEDLLLNGFDRTDIDNLAGVAEVRKRVQVYIAAEELADVRRSRFVTGSEDETGLDADR